MQLDSGLEEGTWVHVDRMHVLENALPSLRMSQTALASWMVSGRAPPVEPRQRGWRVWLPGDAWQRSWTRWEPRMEVARLYPRCDWCGVSVYSDRRFLNRPNEVLRMCSVCSRVGVCRSNEQITRAVHDAWPPPCRVIYLFGGHMGTIDVPRESLFQMVRSRELGGVVRSSRRWYMRRKRG